MLNTAINETGLVVPVDMAALCVGIVDENDVNGTGKFAGATTAFTNQSGQNNAYVGTNVVRSLSAAPLQKLTTGIHLHWNLPEALTRGANNEVTGNVQFNSVPNRWLISRVAITQTGPVRSSWIVESDTLNTAPVAGQLSISLPVRKVKTTDPDYRYTGMYKPFTADWTDPGDNNTFKNLTGQDLSAVASGDSSFAAFYPNCRSLFGFQDTLADLKLTANDGNVDVMYQVTGWFSNTANDPVAPGKTKAELNTLYNWTFNGNDDQTVNYSVYSGFIQNIGWNPYNKYVVDQENQKPIPAKVTIGNTPPEAFAAYFRNQMHPDEPFFETLLNAFQNGLLTEFMQPKPDQLAQLHAALHQKTFAVYSTGTIYQIVQPEKDASDDVDVPIPLPLAQTLNQLNVNQQEYDYYTGYTSAFQWQLFSDWYKMVNTKDTNLQNTLYQLLYQGLTRTWPQMQKTNQQLSDTLEAQKKKMNDQLKIFGGQLVLQTTAPARYWQPNEPVALMVADNLFNVARNRAIKEFYDANGYLLCRLNNQVITALTINSTPLTAQQFSSSSLPAPNHLIYAQVCNDLLLESILLNSQLGAQLTGVPAAELEKALNDAAQQKPQTVYAFTGTVPSPIALYWWHTNPWFPIFTEWSVKYSPLEPTEKNGQLINYTPGLFTNNYTVEQNFGGDIKYIGNTDPATIDFSKAQGYSGSSVVGNSAAQTFLTQINDYLETEPNPTLQLIADELQKGVFATYPLSGLNNLLLQQQQSMQLNIAVTKENPYYNITQLLAQVAGTANTVSPTPNNFFNGVRAGFMQFTIKAVDVYGQKRTIEVTESLTSEQLTTWYKGTKVPNVVYMPGRLTQPTRLFFRWLSAVGEEIEEMNEHPSTTPICGWFLPNRLNGSLFIYDQQGRSMGTLGMNGNQTAMVWQSAPGNNATINQPIEEVFALQNPHLRDTAIALFQNGPEFFKAFWKAIDRVHEFTEPNDYAQGTNLAVMIGRPIALCEAMLRLELGGGSALNQSWATITSGNYTTDNDMGKVQFPVVLGDLQRTNDGLIGYFLEKAPHQYNFSTFYTEGAQAGATGGVVQPTETTILVTPSPKLNAAQPYDNMADARFVLMLIDPRSSIHANAGMLPEKTINIPSNQYADTLGILEMTFLTSPVLHGVSGFNLPVPVEEGYQWSWVEERSVDNKPVWEVIPGVRYTDGQAIADYTPQSIREGWLRLNPQLLRFALLNANGQPAAIANSVNSLRLEMTNRKPSAIHFLPGTIQLKGTPGTNPGSILYFYLGELVPQDKVAQIQLENPDWIFSMLHDEELGNYWAATPAKTLTLMPGQHIEFTMNNVQTANQTGQVQLYFDYEGVDGINNGVDATMITLLALS